MNLLFESLKKIDHFCSFVVLQTSSQTFLDRVCSHFLSCN